MYKLLFSGAASPPSQQRTQFLTVTETFIRLEKERHALERRNARILGNALLRNNELMERALDINRERDILFSAALTDVRAGLRALADAFKRHAMHAKV